MRTPVFFHVDVNSAFLSWSALKELQNGSERDLRELTAAVGGDEASRHGVILAKSMKAKQFGVQTGESIFSARRKCPGLILVRPDFDFYVRCSQALMHIMEDFSPDIEQYSIDEAFLDMTGMEELLGPPLQSAQALAKRVREELGFTVNIGISCNRLLAKMASDFEKPDRIHTLFPDEVPQKMWPLPVGELFRVGGSCVRRLNRMGIHTIGDAARADKKMLTEQLGSQGAMVWDYANGIESTPMVRETVKENSYGNSVTTSEDVTSLADAEPILLSLTETVAARLRYAGKKASVITVHLTDTDFTKTSHQSSLPHKTNTTDIIYETARNLLCEMWTGKPVRLIGVTAGKAAEEEYEQMSLFPDARAEKLQKLDAAMDAVRNRYGEDAVVRARLLAGKTKKAAERNRRGAPGKGGMSGAKLRLQKEQRQQKEGETDDVEG